MRGSGADRDSTYLKEFLRRLRVDDQDAHVQLAAGGKATIIWHVEGCESPVMITTTESDLAAAVAEIGGDSRDVLRPSSTVDEAGFNLLLVHLEEVIATRDLSGGLEIGRAGLIWPDRRNDDESR